MQSMELLRMARAMADRATLGLIEDMRDAPLTRPTPNGGNHPLWVLGHLAYAEGLARQALVGGPHPLAAWAPLFSFGVEPGDDAGAYPAFDEVMARYRELHDANTRLLEEIGEQGLDRPIKSPPPGFAEIFKTPGHVFLVGALHTMHHRGQVADARRAAGRAPISDPRSA